MDHEDLHEQSRPWRWLAGLLAAVLNGLDVGGVAVWRLHIHPQSLLPAEVAGRVSGFPLYFYSRRIPGGYGLDAGRVSSNEGVLIMPLTKLGGPAITLTEQAMPAKLSDDELQQNGDKVSGTAGPATINDIEGRLVGTMLATQAGQRVLILINAPGSADKADLTALLQGLRPVR